MLDRPLVTQEMSPYYQGWNLIDARRQFNESGAQPVPLTDVIEAAKLLVSDDPDSIYEFCVIISICEAAVLKELADQRKRQMEIAKRKAKQK